MDRGLSLYLDFFRLIAAVEVALFHIAGFPLLGGERAWWNAYGHEAVVIFFVLSGFVIRHAAEHRDGNIRDYAISRITRVYSVAIPCLLLTYLFDMIGQRLAPEVYAGLITDGPAILRLGLAGAMLNESALASVQVFSNTPYWSIAYEFWYYFLFAALFFTRGFTRVGAVAVVGIIAGPRILLLFPIWAMGWAAYLVCTRWRMPSAPVSWLLFLQPALAFFLIFHAGVADWGHQLLADLLGEERWRNGLAWSRFVISDTLLGASIALHLIGARGLAPLLWRILQPAARPIRFGAARSFTLYLLHQPAMLLCGAALPSLPLGAARVWLVGAGMLLIIAAVAEVTESQRHRLRPWVARAVDLILIPWRRMRPA